MQTLEERIKNWYYDCYENMIKTSFEPSKQIGWIKNVMYYSRVLKDDAVEWYDIVDDIITQNYFDKWKNTPSAKYNLEHFRDIDFIHLQNLCSKYMTSIATNKIHSYNKKVSKIDNEASLSTDEYEFDLENIAGEEEPDEEDEIIDNLFSMLGYKNKYNKLNKIYNLINMYLDEYDCSDSIKDKLYCYIEEKIKNPKLSQREVCTLVGINHCTVRKFIKSMRYDQNFLRQIHNIGLYFIKEFEK